LAELAQPDISRIVNGTVKEFTMDRLFRALTSLGNDVDIDVSKSKNDRGHLVVHEKALAFA
jgi:predicted XRE-type DNA-binding protein